MISESHISSAGVLLQTQEQEGGINLGRFFSAIKRNIFLVAGVTTLTASAAVFKAVIDEPTYQASFELLTPPTTLETQIISTLNPEALSNQSEIVNVAIDETKLKILRSPRVMEPAVEVLKELYPDITYGQVVGNLAISPGSQGNTLTVQYMGDDPEQVLSVLEVVAETYIKYSLEDRQNDISRGIDFVDEQLPIARQRVEELESELEGLRQRSNLIDPLIQGEQLSQQAAKFTAEQLDLRVQIEEAQKRYQALQQALSGDNEFAVTSALLESSRYQELLNQLLAIDSELADELTIYLEDSPEIEVIRERRENLQPLLDQEGVRVQEQVANEIRELQVRDEALSKAIETLNQQIKRLSITTRQYNNIQRELEIATANLNQLLTKREALRIDAAQRQAPWEMLTEPSSPRASSASAKRNLLLGTALGILLGSGLAILIDRISGKIHHIEELKEVSRVPLLGSIPYEKTLDNEQPITLLMNQLSQVEFAGDAPTPIGLGATREIEPHVSAPFFEAFRILATNLQLSSPDDPIKILSVSSAIPGMGKSTVTFHLGCAVAATGQKVLIVDTDLRRPTLHKICNIPNERGLSNYATGEFDFKDILVDLPLETNLFLVPAGPVPPDPIKILTAQRTKTLFDQIREEFDLIIFDTPPMLGFADAFIVSAKTQGLLLISRLGNIKFSQLQSALDELSIAKVPALGIVANGTGEENDSQYSYYAYYQKNYSDGLHGIVGSDSKSARHDWYKMPLNFISKTLMGKNK